MLQSNWFSKWNSQPYELYLLHIYYMPSCLATVVTKEEKKANPTIWHVSTYVNRNKLLFPSTKNSCKISRYWWSSHITFSNFPRYSNDASVTALCQRFASGPILKNCVQVDKFNSIFNCWTILHDFTSIKLWRSDRHRLLVINILNYKLNGDKLSKWAETCTEQRVLYFFLALSTSSLDCFKILYFRDRF